MNSYIREKKTMESNVKKNVINIDFNKKKIPMSITKKKQIEEDH